MKSIKTKIIIFVVSVIVTLTLMLGIVSGVVSSRLVSNTLEQTLIETASVAAASAQNKISSYTYTVSEIASNDILSNPQKSLQEKSDFLQQKVELYNMRGHGFTDSTGKCAVTGKDLSNEEFFKQALNGNTYMSSPYVSGTDLYIVVSAPIKLNGTVTGIIYFECTTKILVDIISEVSVGEGGDAYILNKEGTTIAYLDSSLMTNRQNLIKEAENGTIDPTISDLVPIEKKMVSGETGFGRYNYYGKMSLQSYAPIKGSDGWSIAITAIESSFTEGLTRSTIFTAAASTVFTIICTFISILFASKMVKPLREIQNVAEKMAKGELDGEITYESKDEIGRLAESMRNSMSAIKGYINAIDLASRIMADGNFDLPKPPVVFLGDFKQIEISFLQLCSHISNVLRKVVSVSDEVTMDADQVSNGAQVLTVGATEQTRAVENLTTSVANIAVQAEKNAANSFKASDMATSAQDAIYSSNIHMQSLMEAMDSINLKSTEIGKIIKTIEDIAFQTNILALNAAVEAAKAGVSGKGFAVVAGEVRNLAGKSSAAAQNTTALIEDSISSIRQGVALTQSTANDLVHAVEIVKNTTEIMSDITTSSNEQAHAVSQLSLSINAISDVAQNNFATSQESAASAQELSSQAHILKDMVSKFTLCNQQVNPSHKK